MRASINFFIAFLLILGIAVEIVGDDIIISYKNGSVTKQSRVSRYHSTCVPQPGQGVFFYKDYKIVQCVDEST